VRDECAVAEALKVGQACTMLLKFYHARLKRHAVQPARPAKQTKVCSLTCTCVTNAPSQKHSKLVRKGLMPRSITTSFSDTCSSPSTLLPTQLLLTHGMPLPLLLLLLLLPSVKQAALLLAPRTMVQCSR
jgi:hypothetical protein